MTSSSRTPSGRSFVAAIVVVLAGLAACANEAEPGSCLRGHDNACVDYDRAHATAGKRMCAGMTWTAGERSCPTDRRLGSCSKQGGAEWLYAGPPNNYDPASAKSSCESNGGSFAPAPSP